ncbi:MAG: hypothetical protein AAF497_28690 [Planctomycetota bacterium]
MRGELQLALSKRKSRPIVVMGHRFRWSFSAPYDSSCMNHRLVLVVQSEEGAGSKIVGTGSSETRNDYLLESTKMMTPLVVSKIIEAKLKNGWKPDLRSDCELNLDDFL